MDQNKWFVITYGGTGAIHKTINDTKSYQFCKKKKTREENPSYYGR